MDGYFPRNLRSYGWVNLLNTVIFSYFFSERRNWTILSSGYLYIIMEAESFYEIELTLPRDHSVPCLNLWKQSPTFRQMDAGVISCKKHRVGGKVYVSLVVPWYGLPTLHLETLAHSARQTAKQREQNTWGQEEASLLVNIARPPYLGVK